MNSFAKEFFKLYDRKILSGEITFSQIGMKKDDFTRLCIDEGYVLPGKEIARIAAKMNLTEEETNSLLAFAEEDE